LREWSVAARNARIDGIEDLTSRPWPSAPEGAVIGVFRAGFDTAHWLVIGQSDAWVVADCKDATVSRTFDSLADALASIFPG
jgi:hypothetical protein